MARLRPVDTVSGGPSGAPNRATTRVVAPHPPDTVAALGNDAQIVLTPLRLPCAVRHVCVHEGRAIAYAGGSIVELPRPIRRPGCRRAPSQASFGSAGSGAPPRPLQWFGC